MKTRVITLAIAIFTLFVLVSCSGKEYEEAMDKGIDSLGKKEYHQASIYFDIALKEKAKDEEAKTYYDQAIQMKNAAEFAKQKQFDNALESLQAVIDTKNGLKSLQAEAKKQKDQLITEKELSASIEKKMALIKSLISKQNYSLAQKELHLLQEKTDEHTMLKDYQSQIRKLSEQTDMAAEKAKEPQKQIEANKVTATNKTTKATTSKEATTYNTYQNARYGFTMQYPKNLTMAPPPTNGDGAKFFNDELTVTAYGHHTNVINEGETMETYYQQDLNSIPVNIAYQQKNNDWYVLSYNENGKTVYKKFFFGHSAANVLIIAYPANEQEKYGPITSHISKTFISAAE